jgi:hypothetical protein
MSLILNLIDSFLRQKRVQPSRPIATKTQTKPTIGKTFHRESYDFSDGYSALQTLAEEMAKGEVKAVPKAWEPDFGSQSSSSAIRSIQGKSESPPPEYFSQMLAQEKYDFSSSSRRPNLSEIEPMSYSRYEKPTVDFGIGSSRRAMPSQGLTEEEKAKALQESLSGPDMGAYDLRPTRREPSPYKTREEMLYGPSGKPQRSLEPTIKSSTNLKKTEKYDFGIGF